MKLLDLPHRETLAATTLTFGSAEERAEFFTYDPDEQANVRELHDAMMRIAGAKNAHQGCAAVAAAARGRSGWSAKYLRTLFDQWQKASQDWRWLVDERRYPAARGGMLDPLTVQWMREVLLKNTRKFAPAIRQIQGQWRSWYRTGDDRHAIPGFVDSAGRPRCPDPDGGYLPRALSEHVIRQSVVEKIEPAVVEIVRYGTHAARAVLPFIPGTRDGVRWLEYVSGDDVELDVTAYVPGFGKARVLQFGFWDMAVSDYLDGFIQRPRTPKNDGTGTWDKLKRRDFLFAVAVLLERYGWPLDYPMHLLCERGTATMSKAQAQWLYEISEGQVIVGYSGMEGEFVCAWQEGKAGNSRAKAGHEGYHGILKNEMGHLKGNQGKDREHAPALDYGREKTTRLLDNVVVQLPPEQRERMILPYHTMPQIWAATCDAIDRIRDKHDHECEGFEQVIEWRPRGLAIEPRPLADLESFLAANPRLREEDIELFDRPETRRERQRRLSAQGRFLAPPSGVLVPFYEDNCELRRIKPDGSFEFEREKKLYRFIPPSPAERLPVGEKVVGFFRPDGEAIHLFTGGADGKNRRYLLTWPSEKKLRRDAPAAVKAVAFSRKEQHFNHAYAQAARATQGQIDDARDAAENNALVMAQNGILPPNVQRGCTSAASAVQVVTDAREQARLAARHRAAAARQETGSLSDLLADGETPVVEEVADSLADFI